ncbi:uncharacterized protein LOC131949149 [Physella acuta]|uniref:uncharacterized protein LOC131949149 n=1 Tax=Physella acuta TaxID=109671 RepID=UPI0027DE3DAF|nr:uncharacterized protein LOC131949149 [Physella acuta]
MPRNVEIKARVADLQSLIARTRDLAKDQGLLIEQEDTFYNVPAGRLKLRNIKGEPGLLIQYDRPDQAGPKLSNFHMAQVEDVENMKIVLSKALGVRGVVKKSRLLIMLGQTRIHLDDVEGLGHFMELEVVLGDDQTVEYGQQIASDIMNKLEISENDLLHSAYMDMLLSK